jgi:hypothetical protein
MGNLHETVPSYAEYMPAEELYACCKVYPFFVMDHKWTGNPDSGLHCLLSESRQARTTPHHKKSPAETGLRAELEGIGRTPKRARNNRLPGHCGKKMPRFEAGLRRVSQHGVFRSAPSGQPAKAATVPALRAGRIRQ